MLVGHFTMSVNPSLFGLSVSLQLVSLPVGETCIGQSTLH
jgi:hypothetical protein